MSIIHEDMKLKHLQYGFNKLTEAHMFYILGLVEGLKHAQSIGNEKTMVKKEVIKYIECDTNNAC